MEWGIIILNIQNAEKRESNIRDAVACSWREIEQYCIGLMLPSQQGKVDGWKGGVLQLLGPEVAARSLEREVVSEFSGLQVAFHPLSEERFAQSRIKLEEAVKRPVRYDE